MTSRFVDCRPRDAYLAGHLPGAAHADPERDLTGADGGGRHPLPTAEAFAAWASAAGIGPRPTSSPTTAAPAGRRPALVAAPPRRPRRRRVLDGGLAAGAASVTEIPSPIEGDFVPAPTRSDSSTPRARRRRPDARRRARAGALARRDGADRPGRGPDPGRAQPLLPRRVAAAEGAARRARPRRLLRLGRDRLRRPATSSTSPAATTRGSTPARSASGTRSARSNAVSFKRAQETRDLLALALVIPPRCAITSAWSSSSSTIEGRAHACP